MAGTKAGGIKARDTALAKFGPGFYSEIGRMGGKAGHTGGFAANRELARIAGAIGGHISRRGYKYDRETGKYIKTSAKTASRCIRVVATDGPGSGAVRVQVGG